MTHARVNNSPWIIAISTDKEHLYKELQQKIVLVGAELLIISIIASILMLRIMKPLADKVVRHSEQLRQETEDRFRTLVETTSEWIWEINEQGVYTYSSPAIESIAGYTKEEIIGHSPIEFMPEDKRERISNLLQELSSTHQPIQNLENIYLHKDGRKIILETNAAPYFSVNGEYKGYRGVDRDITERKAIEKELAQHREQLESIVTKRTSELLELNQELESFSYAVSHDLRTPLRAIHGFTSALQEEYLDKFDESGKNYLTRVRHATSKMSELIDDLLRLTKITRLEINIDKTNLSSLAITSIDQQKQIDKNRHVEVIIAPGLYALCDKKLMQIVMDNLISNAWKYSSKQANPSIEVGSMLQEGTTVFFVKDNGVGFDPEYADKIFQPFQRLHTNKEFSGTGIGLATVQRIIKKHRGKIWVTSALNKGATFYFTLG